MNISVPFISKAAPDFNRIQDLLGISEAKNHYTNSGPVKALLEEYLHQKLGLDADFRVLCCSNGTTALHVIMMLCTQRYGVKKWVTPAFTFPSCVLGHSFSIDVLDIDPKTATLPLDDSLLKDYDGVILTNLFGTYSDPTGWEKYCANNGKKLIFDNAASAMSTCNKRNICAFGDYSFGSLHHTKYLGFGEGGFIVCPAHEYNDLTAITNFGFFGHRNYELLSSNFKMSDVSAAFIFSHIENYNLEQHLSKQDVILNGLASIDFVEPFRYNEGTMYNTMPIVFKDPVMEDALPGITAHKYYKPLKDLPNSIMLYDRILNLPLYADLSYEHIAYMLQQIGRLGDVL
jgi:dTDP-4-amino-4,6-dideoxygalactose transaminase